MASKLGEAFVAITAKDMGLSRGFSKARVDVQRETLAMQHSGEKAAKAIGAAFTKMAKTLIAVYLVQKLSEFGKSMLTLASDALETQNKFDVAFKGMAATAEKELQAFSKSVGGLNVSALRDMAARFQLLFNAMNQAPEVSAKMSTALTKLVYDISSLYNEPIESVATNLLSGLVGETEAVRKFAIDISDAALKQAALNEGLKTNMQDMSQAEKIMLRYKIIMAQTAVAQGDLAQTQDQTANRVRLLKENFQMLAIKLGLQLLPYINRLLERLSNIVVWLSKNSDKFSVFIGWLKRAGEAIRNTVNWFGKLWEKLNGLSPKTLGLVWQDIKKFAESLRDLAEALKPFYKLYYGAAFLALAEGIKLLAQAFGMFSKLAAPVMDLFTKMFNYVAKLLGIQDKQVKKQKEINDAKKEESKITPPAITPPSVAKDYTEQAKSLWDLIKQKREDAKATLEQMRSQIGFVSASELYNKAAVMGAQMQFAGPSSKLMLSSTGKALTSVNPNNMIPQKEVRAAMDYQRQQTKREESMISYLSDILRAVDNKVVQY